MSCTRRCSCSWPVRRVECSLRDAHGDLARSRRHRLDWFSVVQTAAHPASAYFSPFTRAWELALGALVAVEHRVARSCAAPDRGHRHLDRVRGHRRMSAVAFNAQTAYPGSLVALPVVGAALIIAGGVAIPRFGAEALLGLAPFRWLGKLSYSLYLWHWPILVIAAERVGKTTLPVWDNMALLVLALVVSLASYRIIENPVRHWRLPSSKSVGARARTGARHRRHAFRRRVGRVDAPLRGGVVPAANAQVVLRQVAVATRITTVSKSIQRADFGAGYATGESYERRSLCGELPADRVPICTLGDPKGTRLIVVYGDSHAPMWIPAFSNFARLEHWRLVVFGKLGCPATG